MTELITATVFLVFILIREKQHQDEVKLLTRSLIAKNVYELNSSEKPSEDKTPVLIPEDQASDEEFLRAIKKQLDRQTPQDKFKEKVNKVWPKSAK